MQYWPHVGISYRQSCSTRFLLSTNLHMLAADILLGLPSRGRRVDTYGGAFQSYYTVVYNEWRQRSASARGSTKYIYTGTSLLTGRFYVDCVAGVYAGRLGQLCPAAIQRQCRSGPGGSGSQRAPSPARAARVLTVSGEECQVFSMFTEGMKGREDHGSPNTDTPFHYRTCIARGQRGSWWQ